MPQGEPFPTTEDRFLGGRVVVCQPAQGYRAGGDPMFLAASVQARAGDRVLDLGAGVGTAGLCLLARVPEVHVTGLEIQAELAGLARRNAAANGCADRFAVVEGSLMAPPPGIAASSFDHVITNPPWYEAETVRHPDSDTKRIGHVEGEADLGTWLKAAVRFLRSKGRLSIIHRADRLGDILTALGSCRVGEVRVYPLWPRPGKAAVRVLVMARKDARTPLEILPGLVLHHPGGGYTAEADAILRDAAPLGLAAQGV